MKNLQFAILAAAAGLALTPTLGLAIPTTFAQTTQVSNTNQFSILNTGGTVTITGSGLDFFTFLVGGTPIGGPILANFSLTATSTQLGACGSLTCPNGDSFSEQGFSGSFSYIVASGPFAGMNLLSGTFGVNGTPANSGGTLSETINGSGGSYEGTETLGNPTGIGMNSDFLSFAGVANEDGTWALSGLSPNFAVDPTGTGFTKPLTGQTFLASNVATFSSEPPPHTNGTPEPTTMALLGSALMGLGLIGRKRMTR